MSIRLELVNLEEVFAGLRAEPVIVNDVDVTDEQEKEKLNSLLFTRYEGDTLDVLPSCDCGNPALRGSYNEGLICNICGTPVRPLTEKMPESTLWIRSPAGVTAMIQPHVWNMLSEFINPKSFDLLSYLTNPMYKLPGTPPAWLGALKTAGVKRGLNFFVENFEFVMEKLIELKIVVNRNKQVDTIGEFELFYKMYGDRFFTRYIPVPSKLVFITEAKPGITFVDYSMANALDAVRTISSIESALMPLSQSVRESRTAKALKLLAGYYESFQKNDLKPKEGWFRKHVYGSRLHFTFRAVITSLHNDHRYDELHLPWSAAVMAFEAHLSNLLLKRGYTPNQVKKHLMEHTLKHCDLLDDLFKELIASHPSKKGFPVIFQRNPTLNRGSAQLFYVTVIKPDVRDKSVSMSVLCLASPNADFDGDCLNGLLINDMVMYERFKRHEPHHSVFDLDRPRAISGYIKLQAPIISTLGQWLHEDE